MSQATKKIVLPGGAGLVGQNLLVRLLAKGYEDIVVLDKHRANLDILRRVHPKVIAEFADLSVDGDWRRYVERADTVVMLQAQIGGNDRAAFERNNVDSTHCILNAMKGRDIHVVHVSSSV